jgi:hypothetical protein
VHRRIVEDNDGLPHFARASQIIAAAVALLCGLTKPTAPEEHRAQREIRTLLEHVVVQQAEGSLSWHRDLDAG